MKTRIYIRGLLVLLLVPLLSSCLGSSSDSGAESGTELELVPADPDTYSCSPWEDTLPPDLALNSGVHGELFYLRPEHPRFTSVYDYIQFGQRVSDLDLFFSQIYIPTRPFDRGFTTAGGVTIQTENGDTLYEYFALKLRGRLQRGSWPQGLYQMALLSDDGAVLNMNFGSGSQLVVDNNGQHPTRMGCASQAVFLGNDPIPYELIYNQGPRFHIALTWLIRPWPADNNPADSLCGQQGNSLFFDSTKNPPEPQSAYFQLLSRGWKPIPSENFLLPEDKIQNPCQIPAPVISQFLIETISSTSVTFTWTTDVPSTSQILYRLDSAQTYQSTAELQNGLTSHRVTVTGLATNTNYVFKAVSRSASGLWSESSVLAARTRR